MRAFACPTCGRQVFFENTQCLNCGTVLAFDPDWREIVALEGHERCANLELAGCNWIAAEPGGLCVCCALTRTRPDDGDDVGLRNFRTAEFAKRRLLFELGELGLPLDGLSFDLLSSETEPVMTGHADGLVTLDLAESDDARREQRRQQLGEPYRTVLGHFRHEVGHFVFPRLVPTGSPRHARARELFGDESADYQQALDRHYEQGPPADWAQRYVSAYATTHPSEDWAETFAHFLHIWDVLQTAEATGVLVAGPEVPAGRELLETDPTPRTRDIHRLIGDWTALSLALNELNRSMGLDDLYPFVLPGPVVEKLGFVLDVVVNRH